MIQINDTVEYIGEQFICWFIEEIDNNIYIHLINDTRGICVLENEIKNNQI
jgi:hypothetical protein